VHDSRALWKSKKHFKRVFQMAFGIAEKRKKSSTVSAKKKGP
jgi:isocitrate/isopropylmalate dehydrogenase